VARAGRANNQFDRIILVVCAALSLLALVLPLPVREPISGALRRTLLAPMVMLQERAELSRRAFLNHEQIMRMRDSAALSVMNTSSLREENERLRALIGLGSRLRWGFIPAEALHGRGVRDESSVILSAGAHAGVQPLSPVVAPEGLVGVVDNVDPTMSHAMLWTHQDFRVSAMSEDGSAFGIVQARLADGPGKYLMEMRGVPFRTSIKPGTLIVTSGLGGVYPRGIPLGRVIDEIKTSESWARTYIIRPEVFPSDVYSVMILLAERASQGVDNVWMVGTSDSAVRNIVAAGDSLARAAALAEAEARRAVQDSIRQDSIRRAAMGISIPVQPPPPQPRPPVTTPRPTPPSTDTTSRPRQQRDTTLRDRDTLGLPTTI
jgi:rod shape-determining protein MreC